MRIEIKTLAEDEAIKAYCCAMLAAALVPLYTVMHGQSQEQNARETVQHDPSFVGC
jgi:hypothetical protein